MLAIFLSIYNSFSDYAYGVGNEPGMTENPSLGGSPTKRQALYQSLCSSQQLMCLDCSAPATTAFSFQAPSSHGETLRLSPFDEFEFEMIAGTVQPVAFEPSSAMSSPISGCFSDDGEENIQDSV